MGSIIVVLVPPFFDPIAGIGHRQEPRCIEALGARTRAFNASMKALSVGFPGREKSISTDQWAYLNGALGSECPKKLRSGWTS